MDEVNRVHGDIRNYKTEINKLQDDKVYYRNKVLKLKTDLESLSYRSKTEDEEAEDHSDNNLIKSVHKQNDVNFNKTSFNRNQMQKSPVKSALTEINKNLKSNDTVLKVTKNKLYQDNNWEKEEADQFGKDGFKQHLKPILKKPRIENISSSNEFKYKSKSK